MSQTTDLVYLACPYSAPEYRTRKARFLAVNDYASQLMRAGVLIFSPISHAHPIAEAGDLPRGWDFWEQYDRSYLQMCKAIVVLMLDGWRESKGVQAEIAIMHEMRKPVYYLRQFDTESVRCIADLLRPAERHTPAREGE